MIEEPIYLVGASLDYVPYQVHHFESHPDWSISEDEIRGPWGVFRPSPQTGEWLWVGDNK